MTPECLLKMKALRDNNIISDTTYEKLKGAYENKSSYDWTQTIVDAHADAQYMKRVALINANKYHGIIQSINSMKEQGYSLHVAVNTPISGIRQGSKTVSIEDYIQGVQDTYSGKLIDFLHETRPVMLGLRRASNPEMVEALVRGVFGDKGFKMPKGVQSIVDSFLQVSKNMFDRRNAAGMDVKELTKYGLPVNHDADRILSAGKQAWIAEAKERFDIRQPADLPKGKTALSDEEFLGKVYDGFEERRGKDLLDEDFDAYTGRGGLTTAHQQFRYLQPKSGKDWMEYTAKYGLHQNPIDAMKEFVHRTAKEIGILETLGTRPRDVIDRVAKQVETMGKEGPDAAKSLRATFDQILSSNPRGTDSLSKAMKGLRDYNTITKLVLSPIRSMNDIAYTTVRSVYNNVSSVKVMSRHISNLFTRGQYQLAGRLMGICDYASQKTLGTLRFNDGMGLSAIERLTDFSLRGSGMNHWTNSLKTCFQLETLSTLTELADKSLDQLPKGMRLMLERYGFGEGAWDSLRKSTTQINGTTWIDPMSDVLSGDIKASFLGMMRRESSIVASEPNARIRSMVQFRTPTNTLANEIAKTITQFKPFSVTTMVNQFAMLTDRAVPIETRLGYVASTFVLASTMGVITTQLYDVAKGRKPRPLSKDLIMEGVATGGAVGLVSDVLRIDPDMYGGVPGFIGGPSAGIGQDVYKAAKGVKDAASSGGNVKKAVLKPLEGAVEQAAFPTKWAPGRLVFERYVWDAARRMTDPDYYSRLQRNEKFLRDRGQGYWSKPK